VKAAVLALADGPDFQEGVTAFLEKRAAKWHFDG
jgi:enoyl-CoA hydratase/carnithine racemase